MEKGAWWFNTFATGTENSRWSKWKSTLGLEVLHHATAHRCSKTCSRYTIYGRKIIVWQFEASIRQRALQSLRSGESQLPFLSVITLRIPISSVALRSDTSTARFELRSCDYSCNCQIATVPSLAALYTIFLVFEKYPYIAYYSC